MKTFLFTDIINVDESGIFFFGDKIEFKAENVGILYYSNGEFYIVFSGNIKISFPLSSFSGNNRQNDAYSKAMSLVTLLQSYGKTIEISDEIKGE